MYSPAGLEQARLLVLPAHPPPLEKAALGGGSGGASQARRQAVAIFGGAEGRTEGRTGRGQITGGR